VADIGSEPGRLGIGNVTVAAASVALMIGLVLPWFEFGSNVTGTYSFSVTDLRRWMYVPFFLALAITASIAVRALRRPARRGWMHWLVLGGACGVDLVLTAACFIKRSPGLQWDVGAYLSLAAAVIAVIGVVVSRIEAWSAST
jgi:hypothetical protein